MGLLSSDDAGDRTFEPICTDENRVLGYYDDPDEDGKRVVWVNSQVFDKVNEEDIDRIVG